MYSVREELIYRGDYSFESGVNGAKALLKEGNRLDISTVMGGNDKLQRRTLYSTPYGYGYSR